MDAAAAAVSSTTTPTVPRVSFRPSSKPKQQFKRSHSTASTGSCCSKSLGVGHFPHSTPTTSSSSTPTTKMPEVPLEDGHAKQHPALQTVCVMDCMRKARIIPNSDEAFPLSNECFDGSVMLLMRSPDVDEPGTAPPANMGPTQLAVSEYFKGKKRRFEFQFQIKLKKVPTGPLFLGCELEHSIKVGALTKGLVGVLLAMVRRINPGFHYSWGPGEGPKIDKASIERGDYEKTHLSFPVEASMDRIVISKPGDPIPKLGEELHESLESVKRRRRMGAGSVEWNTEDTFTMCLWSAYCDWIQWKSSNVPGVSPFLLSRVTGAQPIYLCVYEISSCAAADYKKKRPPHNQNDLLVYSRMEFSNVDKTTGGYAETILGRRKMPLSSEHSVPDTDSVGSEIDTLSRVSHITN